MKRTSDGLIDLLLRHDVEPTYESKKDIKLAQKLMRPSYIEFKKQNRKKENES